MGAKRSSVWEHFFQSGNKVKHKLKCVMLLFCLVLLWHYAVSHEEQTPCCHVPGYGARTVTVNIASKIKCVIETKPELTKEHWCLYLKRLYWH